MSVISGGNASFGPEGGVWVAKQGVHDISLEGRKIFGELVIQGIRGPWSQLNRLLWGCVHSGRYWNTII